MEPEFERERPRETKKPATFLKEELRKSTSPAPPYLPTSYARETDVSMGLMFLLVALVGFVVNDLLTAHLSYAHNVIHLVSGVLAIFFGFKSERAAKIFAYSFGGFYALLGLCGFIFGHVGTATVGHMAEDRYLWVLSPEILELGTTDHILHVLFGAIFIGGALLSHKQKIRGAA
jgi:hypothetical protein